jgi:hypothetical protein
MKHAKTGLKILIIIDEAMTLVGLGYFPAMRWILDEVIYEREDRFLVIFLGTNSRVSNFLPDPIKGSARTIPKGPVAVAAPFLGFLWDHHAPSLKNKFRISNVSAFSHLVQYGRLLWQSVWKNGLNAGLTPLAFIQLAQAKLLARNPNIAIDQWNPLSKEQETLEACALLGIRVGLNIDLGNPSMASKLVASHMRWMGGIGRDRLRVYTGYGSEPTLVEAAATLINSKLNGITKSDAIWSENNHPTYQSILRLIIPELSQGYIAPGEHGELTTRLICI